MSLHLPTLPRAEPHLSNLTENVGASVLGPSKRPASTPYTILSIAFVHGYGIYLTYVPRAPMFYRLRVTPLYLQGLRPGDKMTQIAPLSAQRKKSGRGLAEPVVPAPGARPLA